MSLKTIFFGKNGSFLEKASCLTSILLRLTLIAAAIILINKNNWAQLFIVVLAFVLTYLPKIIERTYKINIPIEFEILIVLFIYSAIFLGEVTSFYRKFWWWDFSLHTLSGIALGFIGFAILYMLHSGNKLKTSPSTVALFSFLFGLGLGTVWEIFEFLMDQFVGINMQKSGLVDTMWDLIVDGLGALFASLVGYLYLKTGEVPIFNNIIRKFVKDNPLYFRSKV